MDYLKIANSPILYVSAKKQLESMKVDKKVVRKVIKASAITTIIPSVAIIMGLISLSPSMGVPVSWARLGMAGSLMYELTIASIGAQTMGAQLGSSSYTSQAFANSVWLMTIGVVPSFIFAIFFLKKYKEGVKKAVSKDTRLQKIVIGTILVCVQVSFVLPAGFAGGGSLLAVLVSVGIMGILSILIVKFKQIWLREYALSLSMLLAVVAVIFAAG